MQAFERSICVFSGANLRNLELAAVTKTEEWLKHHKKGHLNKIPDCPGCQLESGPRINIVRLPSLIAKLAFSW
eukprot:3225396-Amphidinium_carterae.1